ncbi:MAG: hypothetical protein WD037_06025, partial [Balneolales bacterium]
EKGSGGKEESAGRGEGERRERRERWAWRRGAARKKRALGVETGSVGKEESGEKEEFRGC